MALTPRLQTLALDDIERCRRRCHPWSLSEVMLSQWCALVGD
eukprot:COSAG02_NODE_21475_length_786_cov_1.937409_2_plen_41_part_01